MKSAAKDLGRRALAPVAHGLARLHVSPNHVTLAGLVAMAGSGVLLGLGSFRSAGVALLVGGLCDMLDGAVARSNGVSSKFGAFFDSTCDRLAELLFFAGLLVYFTRVEPSVLYALLTFLAAGGSLLVSYTRARAEGLGIDCAVGMMERPERMVLLLIACFVGGIGLKVALWVLTPLVFFTSLQRVLHVQERTRTL
jgi:CDP-diacylglycerol--glycerol-3-phosphate 3-phosphatidyltransferase